MQEQELIIRFQEGDFEAFGGLYEQYIDAIFAFILRKTSDRQVAEDLTSQVWIKAMKGLETFTKRKWASFKSWIYRIAQNSVIDYYRTKKEQLDLDNITEIGFSDNLANCIDNKDKLREVQTILQGFTPIEREVVILRVWDDLSYKEISKLVGKKEDNCKQIYKRTIEKLQAHILVLCLLILIL